ncbi:ataxin-7-like protein 1 [Austrofundulus limnaeus]|uniref:Ataxin-7-like protein 1 n=1 Tax=Austrofundulus limnaeus TaxID=52670 RepID=A0A2I4BQ87_AUSLI|nr:PREDICTED: ataxin-7-like protein 1 [Austrofundulus limnaeus]
MRKWRVNASFLRDHRAREARCHWPGKECVQPAVAVWHTLFRFFSPAASKRGERERERKKLLSAKQQEGRAMATLDRQIPSPDSFLCKPWSSFVSAAKLRFVDNAVSSLENGDKALCCPAEAVQLGKEEMPVRSTFPALEDFCLVVCHVCSKVVTPQGILKHYEKRHSSPIPSRGPLVPMKPKAPAVAPAVAPSPGDSLAFRVPKDYPHSRFSKAPLAVYPPKGARSKTCVSLPVVSLEKMPCLNRADSASHVRLSSSSSSSSTPSPLKSSSFTSPASQRSGEKLTNGRGSSGPPTPHSITPPSSLDRRPSPARSPLDRRASSTPSPSPLDRKSSASPSPSHRTVALPALLTLSPLEKKQQQNGTKTPTKSHRRLSGRVFDPDKHCGVPDPETKRSCTRSLTCKTHSLTQRRAVPGRSKDFNVLLAEHKGLAKEREALREREKEKEKEKDGAQRGKETCNQSIATQDAACPSKSHCPSERPLSSLKLRLANSHIPRAPGGSSFASTSSPLPPPVPPAPAPHPETSPHSWVTAAADSSRLSSDEGDAEAPDDAERPAFHFSSHHPRPLGVCVFSSRLMGRGYYVFDRRWDRMRLALQSMVEKHLNAQMWRKVPLAAESLPSPSSSSSSSHQAPSPTALTSPVLSSPSSTLTYTATFPQSASAAGVFNVRDSPQPRPQPLASGKARNGVHRASRPSKDTEDPTVGAKKRKNSSHSSSSFSSSSSRPHVDNHKRNGSSFHVTLQGLGVTASPSARKKGPGHGDSGFLGSSDDWLSRADGSQSHNSQNCRELGTGSYTPRDPASASHQPMAPPTVPLAYGGGAEGRKRRSPSSYKGKASKLSRPSGLESLFGKGSDSGGILASGPESPRQAKFHH